MSVSIMKWYQYEILVNLYFWAFKTEKNLNNEKLQKKIESLYIDLYHEFKSKLGNINIHWKFVILIVSVDCSNNLDKKTSCLI